ncbi:MAG: 30S ribosomal protein S9 [bacterium]|nr:30S ribosomal protein S9 [bacterium]
MKKEKYFEGVGRRKTAIARVRLFPQKEKSLSKSSPPSLQKTEAQFLINEKPLEEYFQTIELQQAVYAPLNLMNFLEQFKVSVKVKGGGIVSQAEAVRHGVARALVLFNPDFRKKLKKAGYLKRDPRMRERKKFGLKRARRAPQWSKR